MHYNYEVCLTINENQMWLIVYIHPHSLVTWSTVWRRLTVLCWRRLWCHQDVSREEDEFLGLSFSGASASSTTSTPAKSPGGGRGSSFGSPKPVRPRLNSMTDVTWSPEDVLALAEAPQRRSRLPPPKEREKSVSLWSIIRVGAPCQNPKLISPESPESYMFSIVSQQQTQPL